MQAVRVKTLIQLDRHLKLIYEDYPKPRDKATWSGRKLSVVCVGHCFTELMNSDMGYCMVNC